MEEQSFYFHSNAPVEQARQYAETIGTNVDYDESRGTLSFETEGLLTEEQVEKLKSFDPYSWGYA